MYYQPYVIPQHALANWSYHRNSDMVIGLIEQSIQGERNDELFYDFLIKLAPTQQQKEVITGIRDDERKHRAMFRTLYTQLTGKAPAPSDKASEQLPASYLEGIEKALLGELKAFEKYRTIYLHINPQYRDWIFEIMTDEIKHAGYYNWLYAKNK
ncbi:Rubrerythrin [Paenibacillus sophorae]|uniref:Ferritin-like domain-containing protein n=1 Tax=Paenibacillus sophorae TaxID=1333845 RepID=A0A1H8QZR0_9BACL|nr:ferritin-like domain-containing protein [Paenibacillus sophorae]QWU14897.1 ferritin-like domain-containing protein [Paenibacillus sophorae]SEO59809.1 Rubrerythrin [Paenibacillus sophorae]